MSASATYRPSPAEKTKPFPWLRAAKVVASLGVLVGAFLAYRASPNLFLICTAAAVYGTAKFGKSKK